MPRTPSHRALVVATTVGIATLGLHTPSASAQDAAPGAVVTYAPEPTPALASLVPTGTDVQIVQVLWYALDAVGKPYAFGRRGPDSYDCSGLVDAAYRSAGLTVGATTTQQVRSGIAIAGLDALEPGDLLFVPGLDGNMDQPGHVGLYLGNGVLVQATHTGDVVRITPVSAWHDEIAAVRRILTPPASPIAARLAASATGS